MTVPNPPSQMIRLSLGLQALNLAAVVVPFIGLIVAIVALWGWGFSGLHLGLLLAMYLLTAVGVTVGFHRLFTHRAFETYRPVQWALAVFGSMAAEGSLLRWVAQHRRHHQHSDQPDDPHSPHLHGDGFLGMVKGLWHAHVGWIFSPLPRDLPRYAGDLTRDRALRWLSAMFPLWVLIGLLIPAAIGGLATMSWGGALLGLIWGGLVRIFLVHHVTWSINSVCHLWGSRPFRGEDQSRNNFIFGLLALGEGWHNNHHAFPTSARHGLRWWQIDASYYLIRAMSWMGLAWKLKVPTEEAIQAKLAG